MQGHLVYVHVRAGVEAVYVPYMHERPIYVQRLNQMVYIKSRDVSTADGRLETHVWVIELYHTGRMGRTWNSNNLQYKIYKFFIRMQGNEQYIYVHLKLEGVAVH